MPVVYPARRRNQRGWVLVALVLLLGSVGYFVLRGGSNPQQNAEQTIAPASSAAPLTVTTAPSDIGSKTVVALPAASNAPRPAPQWQASLQPSVVAATRVESLSALQVQMEKWSCEAEQCVGDLRIPINTNAGRNHDISAPADILDVLQKKMALSDVRVSLRSIQPDSQGLAVSLEFSPDASRQGRFYTDAEIASIRMESVLQGSKMHSKDPAH